MEHYFTCLNRIFCLNVYNQSLKECFDLIFDRLSVYFDLADKLYFQYRVFSLFRVFSIDHYFKFMFPESVFSKNVAKIFSSEKNRRFGLKIFYESKRIYETSKSDGKRCIKFVAVSKQSDPIILFCEVPVRTFCNCFYSVSLDFLLLKEQNTKGITKTEQFFGACSSSIINFFKTIMYSVNSAIFETIFFNLRTR